MSHQPERKEKDCLNCGNFVRGRYCHVCGQENIIPKQNFWGLIRHFIYDIFHFDGKFFDTLRYLIFRPGFVPKEYIKGKRNSYLDPIRMYLFTSAVFFLVFFSIEDVSKIFDSTDKKSMTRLERYSKAAAIKFQLQQNPSDSLLNYKLALLLDTTKRIKLKKTDSVYSDSFSILLEGERWLMQPVTDSSDFNTNLSERSWFERKLKASLEEKKRSYGDDTSKWLADLLIEFLHKLPYLLFISLPLFALLLKLLYIRNKNIFYSDHAVFTLYHYIFSFILMLLTIVINVLSAKLGWVFLKWMTNILLLWWVIYLFQGMKNFYGQGWFKTFGKFLLLNFLGVFVLVILFIVFLLLSFLF